jgi:hypothetical protein
MNASRLDVEGDERGTHEGRNGPLKLDSPLSEIFHGFQATIF